MSQKFVSKYAAKIGTTATNNNILKLSQSFIATATTCHKGTYILESYKYLGAITKNHFNDVFSMHLELFNDNKNNLIITDKLEEKQILGYSIGNFTAFNAEINTCINDSALNAHKSAFQEYTQKLHTQPDQKTKMINECLNNMSIDIDANGDAVFCSEAYFNYLVDLTA